ncbi:MAG: MarR family transcriptional regulator [Ruminococcaceae bacterium]|jgi:DNA-binding MarR family transcriptional regulator|nr:MarR family transcriptional regulator [Oscillospiraceae bacterium]
MNNPDSMELLSALRAVSGAMHRRNQELVRGTMLKGYHVNHILRLAEGGPQTAKELTEELAVDKGHTSRVLNDLLELGYIRRTGDGRRSPLELTDMGLAIAEKARASLIPVDEAVSRQLSPADYEVFLRVLRLIGALLDPDTSEVTGE